MSGKPGLGALWDFDALVTAAGGSADGKAEAAVTGLSIDSRSIGPGEVFVALKDQRDGHDFVSGAFDRGAAAALVSESYRRKAGDGALIRVADTLQGLESIGRAARARLSLHARVVAVTGSVGKTGTKEMLRAGLSRLGITHAPEKSFNNHWGVPLTLARMPAETQFGVIEIGMNHAGEITPLVRMARPHAAIITTVEAVHLGHFASVEEIADAKAEIMLGVEPGGAVVLNRDNPHFARLQVKAAEAGVRVVSFGRSAGADIRLIDASLDADGSVLDVVAKGRRIRYEIAAAGEHIAINSLGVVGALCEIGLSAADLDRAMAALSSYGAPAGRGARETLTGALGTILLIDEAYNANPASMRAALAAVALVPRSRFGRRIAVLGDMLELGDAAPQLHAGLSEAIDAAGIDLVFAAGPNMRHLFEGLPPERRGAWGATSDVLAGELIAAVRGGDVVVVKGSLGSRMGPLVEALRRLAHAGGEAGAA